MQRVAGKICKVDGLLWSVDTDHLAPWIERVDVSTGYREIHFIDGADGCADTANFKQIANIGSEIGIVDYHNSLFIALDAASVNNNRFTAKFVKALPPEFYPTVCAAYRPDKWVIGNIVELLLVDRDSEIQLLPRPDAPDGFIHSIAVLNDTLHVACDFSNMLARFDFIKWRWEYDELPSLRGSIVMLLTINNQLAYVVEERGKRILQIHGETGSTPLSAHGRLTGIVSDHNEILYQIDEGGQRSLHRFSA